MGKRDAIVSDELASKFATERDTPYTRWVKGEGLDIIGAHYVPNLHTVDLKPWPRRGGRGVYINHEASRTSNDCYVCEIPPGKSLAPQRQLFEDTVSDEVATYLNNRKRRELTRPVRELYDEYRCHGSSPFAGWCAMVLALDPCGHRRRARARRKTAPSPLLPDRLG